MSLRVSEIQTHLIQKNPYQIPFQSSVVESSSDPYK